MVILFMFVGKYYSSSPGIAISQSILKMVVLTIYITIAYMQLWKYRKNVKNIFSNEEQKYLGWLFILYKGLILLFSILFFLTFANMAVNNWRIAYDSRYFTASTDIFLIFLCYFGTRQPNLYKQRERPVTNDKDTDILTIIDETNNFKTQAKEPVKSYRPGLSHQQAEETHKKLLKLMEESKPYLNENLTLFSLAQMIGIHPNYLSQIINTNTQKNFFDFINSCRVEEFKKRIKSDAYSHYSLLGLAFECGFNSKAAFNRAFKKFTGMTPSEFKIKFQNTDRDGE
jgi:AraC-like DNA-binding protein